MRKGTPWHDLEPLAETAPLQVHWSASVEDDEEVTAKSMRLPLRKGTPWHAPNAEASRQLRFVASVEVEEVPCTEDSEEAGENADTPVRRPIRKGTRWVATEEVIDHADSGRSDCSHEEKTHEETDANSMKDVTASLITEAIVQSVHVSVHGRRISDAEQQQGSLEEPEKMNSTMFEGWSIADESTEDDAREGTEAEHQWKNLAMQLEAEAMRAQQSSMSLEPLETSFYDEAKAMKTQSGSDGENPGSRPSQPTKPRKPISLFHSCYMCCVPDVSTTELQTSSGGFP